MDTLAISGPAHLSGTVTISGSKNSALPMLFMSLLSDSEIRYTNVPRLWDVETTLSILEFMGCQYDWNKEEGKVSILPLVQHRIAPYEWVRKMRAGILALGPLIAKYGEAKVSLPGGCAIGARPVDLHIQAMKAFGVDIQVEQGYIVAKVPDSLRAGEYAFPIVSVTGTANALIVAAVAPGTSIIRNAAREPEVTAVAELLKQWGAEIDGVGSSTLTIRGRKLNKPQANVMIPYDRIEAGTWIAIATATQSELFLKHCPWEDMKSVLDAFSAMGVEFEMMAEDKTLRVIPPFQLKPIQLRTEPYPGFPTDMQAQILVALCRAEGESVIEETIFENRFMHVAELRRLGAQIDIQGHTARVKGPTQLKAAPLMATDLRASASLVIAALAAQGRSLISRIYHLDRGYQRLDEKLQKLGARIERIRE